MKWDARVALGVAQAREAGSKRLADLEALANERNDTALIDPNESARDTFTRRAAEARRFEADYFAREACARQAMSEKSKRMRNARAVQALGREACPSLA